MNTPTQAEALRIALDTLREYANTYNWSADEQWIKRVWLEPGSTSPETYNGFELARKAVKEIDDLLADLDAPAVQPQDQNLNVHLAEPLAEPESRVKDE